MHDGLYENQDELGPSLYRALARGLDLPAADLDRGLGAA